MATKRMLLISTVLGLLAGTSLLGTEGQVPPQSNTIKVTTRLVQVNVVVLDKKGEPVNDLTKDDFEIFDKGQQQKLVFFSKESAENLPANLPPLAPGVVSNRYMNFTSGGQTHLTPIPTSLTVILLDSLNTTFEDQHYSKEALIKVLRQLQPSDRVAVYALTDRLTVLHEFTSDTESLLASLAKHENHESSTLSSSAYHDANTGTLIFDLMLDYANDRIANFSQAQRIRATLEALQAISRHLEGMSGRKNLIWISGGFPTIIGRGPLGGARQDYADFSDQILRAFRTLSDVGLAIYPVDSRGVMGGFETMPSTETDVKGPNPRRRPGPPTPEDRRADDQISQTRGNLREIADRTGGRAFLDSNDLATAIRRAMNDTRVSYALAYAPSHAKWDGGFREIKIKLNRPGLEARYRQGYFAYPDMPADAKQRQVVIAEAVNAPLASTGLGVTAAVVRKTSERNPLSAVRAMVDAHEIAFQQNAAGKPEATLDFLLVVFDEKGERLHQLGRSLRIQPDEPMLKNGIAITADSEVPARSVRARLVVLDVLSGAVGSVDIPLK
jgi:VWFA-related protein